MKLKKLYLKNIGPFLDDEIEFATNENAGSQVTIITGENGAGKTIIIDAIRKMFLEYESDSIRSIRRNNDFLLNMELELNYANLLLEARLNEGNSKESFDIYNRGEKYEFFLRALFDSSSKGNKWILNYWTSQNDHQTFHINALGFIKPEGYLRNCLDGIQRNTDTTQVITFFDYFKSSSNPTERAEGEYIYGVLKKIFEISLLDGELLHVERSTFLPVIRQNGVDITIEKLSSGNLYLVQRLISLLSQMYSVYKLNDLLLEELCLTPGVLLIDEAENHLHPKWQKTFLNSILKLFPNIQIIVTTHSPFIVGSVEGAKVYVCKPEVGYSRIIDETSRYSNKPIEEILSSDVFGETSSFANAEIDKLLQERIKAIEAGDKIKEKEIEEKLVAINPQYFGYLNLDDTLKQLLEAK
ncbi:AAA family ATPase [Myroides sp. N17-2]|uniref:AAA family ATPase n=1 Tax=Myroides sp. N17-2 TaxID=2030799 RepID=UPI000EFC7878|nr:AAA family ATPase [Myroides sp. N17-2]